MFLTVKQAAELLGLELHRVYYLLVMGNIEGVKIAKSLAAGRSCRQGLSRGLDRLINSPPERREAIRKLLDRLGS